jgi:hypothetical protein
VEWVRRGMVITKTKPVARSMGTQAMWMATLVGLRWYAPYFVSCRSALGMVGRLRGAYKDEVLL